MPKHVEYIIVGQGLAGTMLGYFLELAGKNFVLIDTFNNSSSSRIAAGIIHPVTGRRIVKTWRAEELIPFAEKIYAEFGHRFNRQFYYSKSILEIYSSVKNRNDWISRSADPMMNIYIGAEYFPTDNSGITPKNQGIQVKQGGHLLIGDLLNRYRDYLLNKKLLVSETIHYDDLVISKQGITWKDISADAVVFCEGANAQFNPWFSGLPFLPAKGEILTVEAPLLSTQFIINKGLYILPIGNNLFKVGSTHEWNYENNLPSEEARAKLVKQLSLLIDVPFLVVNHEAAVRPTVKDRRPFLGTHRDNQCLHIFNGLGTKGVLLAPFFAHQLCEWLVNKKPLEKEVNINRFL